MTTINIEYERPSAATMFRCGLSYPGGYVVALFPRGRGRDWDEALVADIRNDVLRRQPLRVRESWTQIEVFEALGKFNGLKVLKITRMPPVK